MLDVTFSSMGFWLTFCKRKRETDGKFFLFHKSIIHKVVSQYALKNFKNQGIAQNSIWNNDQSFSITESDDKSNAGFSRIRRG